MNVMLWIVQLVLALVFIMSGVLKAFQYKQAKEYMDWVGDVPKGVVIFLGFAEILGGVGLLFPMALGVLPIFTPIAAFALAILMLFAAIFHYHRKEIHTIPINVILLFIALFITIGRLYF